MNWDLLLSALAGLLTGGGVSWLFKLREDKANSQADAIDKSADAMKQLLENIEQQQIKFNTIIDGQDKLIERQRGLIEEYRTALDEANRKLKELDYKVSDYERKLEGMQKLIDELMSKKNNE